MFDLEKQLEDQKDEIAQLQATVTQLETKQIRNNSVSNIKPKMNLCQNYMNGYCPFRDKCTYAHGLHELRNPLYKTKMCQNLPNCKYGDNCINAHSKVVMDQLIVSFSLKIGGELKNQLAEFTFNSLLSRKLSKTNKAMSVN